MQYDMTLGVYIHTSKRIFFQICMLVLCPNKLGYLTWLFLHQKGERGVGIYNSGELFTIGSWRVFFLFLGYFIPICWEVMVMISYLGSWLGLVCLMCAPITFGCLVHLLMLFLWKSIWCVEVPKGVSFFLWTAARDEIFTIDNIVKRGP